MVARRLIAGITLAAAAAAPASARDDYQPPKTTREVRRIIRNVAARYRIDADRFERVARCESGYRYKARSRNGRYIGLFQHDRRYWKARARRAGLREAAITGPWANSTVSAWMIRHGGGWRHWPTCSRRNPR